MTRVPLVQVLTNLDFDPKSVKVSRLRGILNENSIEYPSNAKKNELIAIFNEQLKPQSGQILRKWENSVKSHGKKDDFINVSSEVIKNLQDIDTSLDSSADVIMLSSDEEPAKKPKRVYKSKREKKIEKSPDDEQEGKGKKSEKIKEISDSKTKKSDSKHKQKSAQDSEEDVKAKKSKKTKTEDEEKPKRTRKLKAEAESSTDEIKPKKKSKEDASVEEAKPKRKSKVTSEADESIEVQPQSKGRTPDLATPESAKRPRGRPRKIQPEATPSSKSFIEDFSISEEDTSNNNSNFEYDNVFQSGGNSSASSPSIKKKRHLEEEVEDKRKSKKKHVGDSSGASPSTTKQGTPVKRLEKTTVSSPSETKKRTPRTLKHESPVSSTKSTPRVKEVAESPASSTKASTEKTQSEKSTPLKFSDIANESGKKTHKSTPKSAKTSTPSKSMNLKDETKSFDEALRKIKNEAIATDAIKTDEQIVLNNPQVDLMKQTGIIIEDLSQPNLVSSPLKPRLRTIQEKKQPLENQVDDDEDSDEDEEGEAAIAPPRSKVSFFKVFKVFSFLFLWVSLISLSLFGYWYREQQYLIGYCGHEIDVPTIPKHADFPPVIEQLGKLLDDRLKPSCIKCPSHARCFRNLEIGCYEDFIEYKPWYFDYSPILDRSLKKCVPDTKKAEKLEIMIDVALDLLRSKNADKNCGKSPVDSVEGGLESSELHDLLLAMKAPYITEEEFEELWSRALVELEKEPEIIVRQVY